MRILLVEDEPSAAHLLAKGLREQAYAVDVAADGETAIFQIGTTDYDAVVLDVMLPVKNGLVVCRTIRESGSTVPILMVTARDAIESRIAGLDSGADDYLVKPFDFGELLARLRSLIRRGRLPILPSRLTAGPLTLATRSRRARDDPHGQGVRAARVSRPPRGRRRQPRRHRGARLGRSLRSAVERRGRVRSAAAPEAGAVRRRIADPNAPRRRLSTRGGRRR